MDYINNVYKTFNKNNVGYFLLILPSAIGIFIFFIIPFIISFYYAITDNTDMHNFVGLQNFINTLNNKVFIIAFKNTLQFASISIYLNIIISLFLATLLNSLKLKIKTVVGVIFLLPIVIPSGSLVFFWKAIWDINGLVNKMFFMSSPINWIESEFSKIVIIIIFLWKSVGYSIILFLSGLNSIPKEYYEISEIEGMSGVKRFIQITLVYLRPTSFLVFIMSIINLFKSFKEIYLLGGNYPNQSIYMIQHYINNQFLALDYQKLSSATYILFTILTIFIAIIFYAEAKSTKFL